MSEVAALPENRDRFLKVKESDLAALENLIESYSANTKIPSEFILPRDSPVSASLSVARTVTRRAERRLVELKQQDNSIRTILFQYLNRISSFLYILEIHVLQNQTGQNPLLAKAIKK